MTVKRNCNVEKKEDGINLRLWTSVMATFPCTLPVSILIHPKAQVTLSPTWDPASPKRKHQVFLEWFWDLKASICLSSRLNMWWPFTVRQYLIFSLFLMTCLYHALIKLVVYNVMSSSPTHNIKASN